jgi:hypothetical protein
MGINAKNLCAMKNYQQFVQEMEIVLQLIIVCKTGFYGTNCKDVMCNGKLSTVCSGNGNCYFN